MEGRFYYGLFRIRTPVSQGIGIGTASHAIGTSKAYEMGEIQGAISSVSIGLTGLLTVLILPVLLNFLSY
ncbi:LrgB family protein [Wukongibacter sp. M2B1]|uniref:LrgB family protein n=1 Tax=Wukongibacter sp. M2B1 TaxID=3088895 RepID=UPI003D7A790D